MNSQEEQEYQERMGSPEMEYLQYQTDFPEQHPPMTTLNTIIEEEKKELESYDYEEIREDDKTLYREYRIPERDFYSILTTAMQRAYEAGVEDGKGTKTPDHATH